LGVALGGLAVTLSDQLLSIYSSRGADTYFGEAMTTLEHSLQAAYFAEACDAPDTLIIAALLHDIGHLIEPARDNIAEWKSDARHEVSGSRWLATRFGPEVSEPVRLHVPAKRYLCAKDAGYIGRLSGASIQTLRLQGGPMSDAEIFVFETEPHFREAILLRQWDDQGKVAGLATPPFSHYGEIIDRLSSA
jgi:[1-hydroxy-2-(trimethylamino)ethyl]phosphonate dioxygenase